jgi:hypothetical protein
VKQIVHVVYFQQQLKSVWVLRNRDLRSINWLSGISGDCGVAPVSRAQPPFGSLGEMKTTNEIYFASIYEQQLGVYCCCCKVQQ